MRKSSKGLARLVRKYQKTGNIRRLHGPKEFEEFKEYKETSRVRQHS